MWQFQFFQKAFRCGDFDRKRKSICPYQFVCLAPQLRISSLRHACQVIERSSIQSKASMRAGMNTKLASPMRSKHLTFGQARASLSCIAASRQSESVSSKQQIAHYSYVIRILARISLSISQWHVLVFGEHHKRGARISASLRIQSSYLSRATRPSLSKHVLLTKGYSSGIISSFINKRALIDDAIKQPSMLKRAFDPKHDKFCVASCCACARVATSSPPNGWKTLQASIHQRKSQDRRCW